MMGTCAKKVHNDQNSNSMTALLLSCVKREISRVFVVKDFVESF
jgi:hypothetical protein